MNQQLAMKEAMSGSSLGKLEETHSRILTQDKINKNIKPLNDPRLKSLDVSKYEYYREFTDPITNKLIDKAWIHYLIDNKTGVIFDLKFKIK
ncbi:MAG: hypothetical protein GY830_04865 [Bacteroidetes bacterium]|nr:hypothetical protein [Bacteroidota bacterium]